MPIIEIQAPQPTPPEGLLQRISGTVQRELGLGDDRVWVLWRPVADGCHYRPGWRASRELAGPIVHIRCKPEYSESQAQRMLQLIAGILAECLGVHYDSVFALVDRVNQSELLVRGALGERIVTERIELQVLARVANRRKEVADDHWGEVVSEITFDQQLVSPESLDGIEGFSHVEVVYFMHGVPPEKIQLGARHPRNLAHLPKVGILAQRPKARPNRLGLSRCELLERSGLVLRVKGLDAIDGTPVLDLKPYFREFGPRGELRQPDWTREILTNYF